jgi:hypothetical protein
MKHYKGGWKTVALEQFETIVDWFKTNVYSHEL